jgi:hypothetical protein
MPSLNWIGKHHADPEPASLIHDSNLYPSGGIWKSAIGNRVLGIFFI